jgi:MoaA/NifB/PqqE/SkfB family radical SAM enzyme
MLTDQTFMVANRCNLACSYCYYEVGTSRYPRQVLSPIVYDRWLTICREAGHRVERISFTGGEPTLRGDFVELLAVAAGHARVTVFTNAVRLSDRVVDAMAELTDEVHVSIDHVSPAADDRVRGGTRATLAGIHALAGAGVRQGRLCIVLTSQNWRDIPAVTALGKEIGWAVELIAVSVPPTHPLSLAVLPAPERDELVGHIQSRLGTDRESLYYARLLQTLRTGRVSAAAGCRTAREGVFVSSDGEVGLCPQRTADVLGNITSSSPDDIVSAKARVSERRSPGSCVSLGCLVLL